MSTTTKNWATALTIGVQGRERDDQLVQEGAQRGGQQPEPQRAVAQTRAQARQQRLGLGGRRGERCIRCIRRAPVARDADRAVRSSRRGALDVRSRHHDDAAPQLVEQSDAHEGQQPRAPAPSRGSDAFGEQHDVRLALGAQTASPERRS